MGGVALAGVSAAGNLMFLVPALTQTLSVGTVALVSHGARAGSASRRIFRDTQASSVISSCRAKQAPGIGALQVLKDRLTSFQ